MPENKHSSGQFEGGGGEEEAEGKKKNHNKMMWGRNVNPGREPGALLLPSHPVDSVCETIISMSAKEEIN